MKTNHENIKIFYDIVINNGCIIDPKEELITNTNIGVKNGKIKTLSKERLSGTKEINAKNMIISPGFIDFCSHVDGNLYSGCCIARQGGTTTIGGYRNFDGKAIKKIAEEGFIINHGFCISHSFTLRIASGIENPYRPATKKEIKTMAYLAEKFIEYGALGIHFGLEFFPGTSKDEIINIARISKKYNCLILIHMRKDGLEALDYFDDILITAKKTEAPIHILKLMYMVGIGNAMDPTLEMIDLAREQGFDITADSGIYDAFPACLGSCIFDPGWENEYRCSYDKLLISSGIYAGNYCNKELFHKLRNDFPDTLVTAFVCNYNDIPKILRKPYIYISTDAAHGPHYPGIGHPETSGTFPKLIGYYSKEKNLINLLEALKKITILPAKRFGLKQKGWIGIGSDADLVIFDYSKIIDKAEYINSGNPNASPEGIEYVIVNGEIVVEKGITYDYRRPGRLLNNFNGIS